MERVEVNITKALGIEFLLHACRQVDKSSLTSTVAGAVGNINCSGTRRDVDNATTTLFTESWEDESHKIVGSVQVHSKVTDEFPWILRIEL
jgi:hypothetical protein